MGAASTARDGTRARTRARTRADTRAYIRADTRARTRADTRARAYFHAHHRLHPRGPVNPHAGTRASETHGGDAMVYAAWYAFTGRRRKAPRC
jgi:hypothetical protein